MGFYFHKCEQVCINKYFLSLKTSRFSPWDLGQISIKLGTKHVIYQKLTTFLQKEGIYLDRLESVIFSMLMCILQTRTYAKGGLMELKFEVIEM